MTDELKKERDKADVELITMVAKRLDLSQKIIQEKKAKGEELHVSTDEIQSLDKAKIVGNAMGLDDAFLADLFSIIFREERKGY